MALRPIGQKPMEVSRRLLAERYDEVGDIGRRIWTIGKMRIGIVAPVHGAVDPSKQIGKTGHFPDPGEPTDRILESCHPVQNLRSGPRVCRDDDLD
jgi:hypothetical protein